MNYITKLLLSILLLLLPINQCFAQCHGHYHCCHDYYDGYYYCTPDVSLKSAKIVGGISCLLVGIGCLFIPGNNNESITAKAIVCPLFTLSGITVLTFK